MPRLHLLPGAEQTMSPRPASIALPGDFDAASRATLLSTALTGALVAWAPILSQPLRSPLLCVALLVWAGCVTHAVVCGLAAASHRGGFRRHRLWTLLGIAGVAIALLSAIQLEVVRVLYHRPDLSWNVDWRWAWNHAQAIARFGSLDRALDYTGWPIEYHVGPSWLAGATQRLLGFGLTHVLFGAVPALCILSTVVAAINLLSISGVPRRLAAAAAGIAACVPLRIGELLIPNLLAGKFAILIDLSDWLCPPSGLMLNILFGLAVGTSSLVLLVDHRSRLLALAVGGFGLASLVQNKPQFLISLGCLAGIVAVARIGAWSPGRPRSAGAFIGCTIALAATCLAMPILPKYPCIFAIPRPALAFQAYSLQYAGIEVLLVPFLAALLAAWAWRARSLAIAVIKLGPLAETVGATLTALLGLAALLMVLEFPLREFVRLRAAAADVSWVTFAPPTDLNEMMVPLRFLLISGVVAALCKMFPEVVGARRLAAVALGSAIIAAPAADIVRGFWEPLRGHDAAEDVSLHEALRAIPRAGSLVISSDLADPAEDTTRRLRGFLLTAYEGHEFYVATIVYLNYLRPDAAERMASLQAFFGSPWTAWHDAWLARAGITHVLVHDRCRPVWWTQRQATMTLVAAWGGWSLFVPRQTEKGAKALHGRPAVAAAIPHTYGRAPCL